jgi:hypothetical protein
MLLPFPQKRAIRRLCTCSLISHESLEGHEGIVIFAVADIRLPRAPTAVGDAVAVLVRLNIGLSVHMQQARLRSSRCRPLPSFVPLARRRASY